MTSSTPGRLSKTGRSTAPRLPVMPIAVRCTPGMGWALKPRASMAATAPRISSGVALWRITTSKGSGPRGEPAPPTPVEEVEDQPGHEPEDETLPCQERQARHQEDAHTGAQERDEGDEGDPELPRPLRLARAQDQDADADEDEGEERADVGELHDLVDVGEGGEEGNERPREDRGHVRGAVAGVDLREPGPEEPVAGHHHEDAGLAELEDQANSGHADHH